MAELATRARWYLNSSSARNVQLKKLKNYSISDDSDLEHAYNTSDDAPVGIIDKPGGGSVEFDYYQEAGAAEVDWRKLKLAKEFFSMTEQIVGGRRTQYIRCRVATVTNDGDEQGSHMQKIKVLWAERKDL